MGQNQTRAWGRRQRPGHSSRAGTHADTRTHTRAHICTHAFSHTCSHSHARTHVPRVFFHISTDLGPQACSPEALSPLSLARQTDTPIQKGVTILHAVGRGTEVAAESPVASPQEWHGALTQTIYHHRGATAPTLLTTDRMPVIWGNNISACEAKVNGPGYECHPLG